MTLLDLLADPTAPVELIYRVAFRNPATDVEGQKVIVDRPRYADTAPRDPRLADAGRFGRSLRDSLIPGTRPGSTPQVIIDNSPPGPLLSGPFDDWRDLTFDGRKAELLAGVPGAAIGSAYPVWTATVRGEPEFLASSVQIQHQDPLDRLSNLQLGLRRYVGAPHAVKILVGDTSGRGVCGANAAWEISEFSIAGRFYMPSGANTAFWVASRELSAANRSFIAIAQNNGTFQIISSGTTVGAAVPGNTWHKFVGVIGAGKILLYIDDKLSAQGSIGATHLAVGASFNHATLSPAGTLRNDIRFYSRRLTASEARVEMATIDPSDPSLLSHWKYDENGGATVTDYGATAKNAALNGAEGVGYIWTRSFMGDYELAGRPEPYASGHLIQAPLTIIDRAYNIARWTTDVTLTDPVAVSSRGVELEEGVDWEGPGPFGPGPGLIEFTSPETEPLTHGTESGAVGWGSPRDLATSALERSISASELDALGWQYFHLLINAQAGYYAADGDPSLDQVMRDLVRGVGADLDLTPTGLLVPRFLLPPISPGPYGSAVVEFRAPNPGFALAPVTFSGDHTVCAWVRPAVAVESEIGGAANSWVDEAVWENVDASNRGMFFGLTRFGGGTTNRRGRVQFGHPQLTKSGGGPTFVESPNTLQSGWSFVAGVYDNSAKTRKIYIRAPGGVLTEVASQAVTGTLTASTGTASVGELYLGGLSGVQVWSVKKTLSELDALANALPSSGASNLLHLLPLDEGAGNAYQLVGNVAHALPAQVLWAPRVRFDLDLIRGTDYHERILPQVSELVVEYARNYAPLVNADISDIVSGSVRMEMRLPARELPYTDPAVETDYVEPRTARLASPLRRGKDAARIAGILAQRLAGRVSLAEGLDRRVAALQPTDEVWLRSYRWGLSAWVSFRVVSAESDLKRNKFDLGVWRP